MPITTLPRGLDRSAPTSDLARASVARMPLAYSLSRPPASVSTMPRPLRCTSWTPSSSSSARTCRLSIGCATPSTAAAREKLPNSATTENALSFLISIAVVLTCNRCRGRHGPRHLQGADCGRPFGGAGGSRQGFARSFRQGIGPEGFRAGARHHRRQGNLDGVIDSGARLHSSRSTSSSTMPVTTSAAASTSQPARPMTGRRSSKPT